MYQCTLRGHFNLRDGAVSQDRDGLDAGFAEFLRVIGWSMIEDIPLPVKLLDGTMVVPAFRVAANVVNDNSFVSVRAHRIFTDCITQTRRTVLSAIIGKNEVIEVAYPTDG